MPTVRHTTAYLSWVFHQLNGVPRKCLGAVSSNTGALTSRDPGVCGVEP